MIGPVAALLGSSGRKQHSGQGFPDDCQCIDEESPLKAFVMGDC
jgi:hypothetical protein